MIKEIVIIPNIKMELTVKLKLVPWQPIDNPPKMASWRTSFVGPSIVFTCQSCLCKSLSPSPSPIIGQWYYNGGVGFHIIISIQASDA